MFRMRLALWRNRASATCVLAAALLVVLSACTTTPAAQEEETPTPVLFTATTMTADTVTATLPVGWKEIPQGQYGLGSYVASPNGTNDTSVPSISLIQFDPQNISLSYGQIAPDTYDLDAIVNRSLFDLRKDTQYSNLTDLGTRTIGGAPARGYVYVYTDDGVSHRTEKWHVGRHDGLWDVQLRSADNDTTFPPEIYDILNTITWATPTPTLFTATTMTADTVTATLPVGWKEIPQGQYDPASYVASPNGTNDTSAPSISLFRSDPENLSFSYKQATPDTFNLDNIFGNRFADIWRNENNSDATDLGTRTIGGATARGCSFTETVDGISHRTEIWELGRHDGLWTIQLRSALNDTTLPPEIYDILNTITWTTPTP